MALGAAGQRVHRPLIAALPGLYEHGCSYGKPGGFIRRLVEDDGTWMGHILEHVAIELQNVAGEPVTFGKTRSHGEKGHYHVVYQYEQEDVGLEAGRLGLMLLHSLLPADLRPEDAVPADFDFAAERDEFIRFAQRRALGPSTMSLVRAAEERRIPWIRLNEQSLIQLGHGRYQQRVQATVTSRTPHIAVELASDKEETNRILANLGLPVPRQRLVQREDDAVAAAERIGYPVVVKPFNANHGRGITIHVTSEEEVRRAFEVAREHSRSVIVESFITGEDHRMVVIAGELVAVARRVPGHVVGDGTSTIEQLVEEVNRDPRRGIGHEKVLTRLMFDHQAETMLARKGYTRETVPAAGEQVFLRSTGNLSTGGTATDMTDVVHPDNAEMAVRAVKAIGLDVGGVDFLSTDITQSYKEVGGAICEINAAPGFRMHMAPSEGRPRDVAGPVMDMLFPPGTPSRIPIAAVTGTNGKTTTARMLAHINKLAGHHVGLTSTDGVYIDGQRTVSGDMTGPVATRMVLSDPSVDVAVLEVARGGLLRAGMGVRHCDVGAVLNVKADHLGLRGIGTLEELAQVKRIVVEVARDTARAQRRRSALPQDGRLHRGQAALLRDDGPDPRAGGRAHQGRRPRRGAGVGDQGPDDHRLRPQRAHPAALDPPDPGHARGPRDAQRPERDVRRGDGLQHGPQAGGYPPWAPDLRYDVLPGAGPDEHLRRAPLQGHPGLRPQPARRRGHVRPGGAAGAGGTSDRGAGRAGRPPGRGHRRHRADRGGPLRSLHRAAGRPAAGPAAGRGAPSAARRPAGARGAGRADPRWSPTSRRRSTGPSGRRRRAIWCCCSPTPLPGAGSR